MADIQLERSTIREHAKRYAEVASMPIQALRMERYRQSNALMGVKPIVLIDEIPWGEMDMDGELRCVCEDPILRGIEAHFRRSLFKWKHFQCDTVLPNYFPVHMSVHSTGIGIEVKENTLDTAYSGSGIISHEYLDQLPDEAAIDRLTLPHISVDHDETQRHVAFLQELFGDILPVKIIGESIYCAIWDEIPRLHGVENLFTDLVDRPEFVHKMMQRFTDIKNETYRQFEELGLFEAAPLYIHCTPALTYEMPPKDHEGPVTREHIWGRGMAQIFGSISPQMHEEFDILYAKQIYGQCKMVYYGCCEPLDKKIDILRKHFNTLRKISITPWADVHTASEAIGKDYVLSYKPNPAFLTGSFDADAVRKEIRNVLDACKRNNTQCEFILKDISSVSSRPQNLIDWERTVMSEIDKG